MNTMLARSLIGIFPPFLIAGCTLSPVRLLNPGAPISGTVTIWVSAEQDTYISCGRTSACEEGSQNFGRDRTLEVAGRDVARKLTFVHFELPVLPVGTKILEAYLELNHTGQREDGLTDDVKIPVSVSRFPWDAMALTWRNNQDIPMSCGKYNICLRSAAWSGSPNIAADIQESQKYDVILNWTYPTSVPPIEKRFASANDGSRTEDKLGLAPRLLIRAQLPPGTTINSRAFQTFQPSEDLGNLPQPVLTSISEATGSWPASWNVAVTNGACQ